MNGWAIHFDIALRRQATSRFSSPMVKRTTSRRLGTSSTLRTAPARVGRERTPKKRLRDHPRLGEGAGAPWIGHLELVNERDGRCETPRHDLRELGPPMSHSATSGEVRDLSVAS